MRTFAEWLLERDGAGPGLMLTTKLQYDRGLFRPQHWKPPVLPKTKKSKKIEILFQGNKKKKNEANNEGVVSFDFDGVLHLSMRPGTTDPSDASTSDLDPFRKMHEMMRKESRTRDIVVVSKRAKRHEGIMWEFIKNHNLPVKEIYTTDLGPKLPVLRQLGAIRHYDDSQEVGNELKGTEIEFVFVKPTNDKT